MFDKASKEYLKVSDNLFYAIDSAGWFWRNGSAWGDLNKKADLDDIYYINIGVNGGVHGFDERIKYIKLLLKFMKVETCTNINLKKELGRYSLNTSTLKNTKFAKNNESDLKEHDDK